MKRLQFCLVVFAVLALTLSAFAQVQNGQFTGTVSDPTGAAIANAKVTVTNPATDLNLTTTTNSSGNYTVKEVPIGTYKLTVEAAGFKTVSNAGVTANAGTIAHVDFKMQIGKASEVIEVTGAAALVNLHFEDHVRNGAGVCRHTDRKSTRLNSSHTVISYAVFCLK